MLRVLVTSARRLLNDTQCGSRPSVDTCAGLLCFACRYTELMRADTHKTIGKTWGGRYAIGCDAWVSRRLRAGPSAWTPVGVECFRAREQSSGRRWSSTGSDQFKCKTTTQSSAAYMSLDPEEKIDISLSKSEEDHYRRELHTINVAITANLAILVAKVGACYMSMSSSMFAEAIHSLADVGNQILLRKGVVQALKGPTPMYPYGFSRDKFVWSLMSAVGIFFLGAGVSVFNGVQGLVQPREIHDLTFVFWVLGGSFVLEGISFLVACRTVMLNAAHRKMKFFEYVWLGKDPTPIAVMLEDSGAVIGIIIAGACTMLSAYTGSSVWDSLGSIAVGVLMGGVASFLIRMNRSFLIGRSIGRQEMSLILRQLKEDPVVKNVYDFKSEEIGPGRYRLKAEIDFSGEVVVERHLKILDRDEVYQRLRHASWSQEDRALDMVLKDYGKELVSQVGAEVDRLEAKIRKAVPGVVHVDLEVDRGKIEKKFKEKISTNNTVPLETPPELRKGIPGGDPHDNVK